MSTDVMLATNVGQFAAVDFGGQGQDVLLLHNTATNLEALRPLGEQLSGRCHPVAIDIRGHGQTRLALQEQRQSWEDLGPICAALGMTEPVIAAEGTMAWMATSAVLQGIISVRALVLLGAHPFVRTRAASHAVLEQLTSADVLEALGQRAYLGRRLPPDGLQAFLDEATTAAGTDWLLREVPPDVWRALLTRAVVPTGDGMLVLQPSLATVTRIVDLGPGLHPFPCAEAFHDIGVPLLFIDPQHGMSADDMAAVEAVVAAGANRRSATVGGVGYLGLAHALDVADEIAALMADLID